MTYDEIYKPLSRTSFGSKMAYSFKASIETMSSNGQVDTDTLMKCFLPDEIETFVLNSIVAKEYRESAMTEKQFIKVMNAIRNYQPPDYYARLKTDGLRWVLPTIGAVQFESQQYSIFRLYRHHCLFTFSNDNINVDKAFKEKFENSFDDYAAIVFSFQMILANKQLSVFKNYWEKICLKASWFINHLKMTRVEYKTELSQFAQSNADYKYCLRPSYSYPFIEFQDKIYLPTPHLLIQSITTAMMNRLTYGNTKLREQIGKNACENYLLTIMKDSGLFDEVVPEYEYTKGQKTLDIMARKGNTALLIDSKLFSPKVALRTYDDEAYKKDVSRIIKDIKQAYTQAREKFGSDYNPFSQEIKDTYAIVVAYQEGYLDLKDIYLKAAQDLSITENSTEFEWLWHHIGFTDVATFERYMLTKTDVLSTIPEREYISDKWLMGRNGSDLTDQIRTYQEKLISDSENILHGLYVAE